jgi:small subunit ribosomal protein S20
LKIRFFRAYVLKFLGHFRKSATDVKLHQEDLHCLSPFAIINIVKLQVKNVCTIGGEFMPNIKSAIKRVSTNNAANKRNSAQKTAMRTAIKKFEAAVASNADNVQELYKTASSAIDRAKTKRLIHKNNASRNKARLASKLN